MLKSNKSRQDHSNTIEWLANAIGQATRAAKFCVIGVLDRHAPQEIPFRDVEWLSGFSCDRTMDGLLPLTQPDSEEL